MFTLQSLHYKLEMFLNFEAAQWVYDITFCGGGGGWSAIKKNDIKRGNQVSLWNKL